MPPSAVSWCRSLRCGSSRSSCSQSGREESSHRGWALLVPELDKSIRGSDRGESRPDRGVLQACLEAAWVSQMTRPQTFDEGSAHHCMYHTNYQFLKHH